MDNQVLHEKLLAIDEQLYTGSELQGKKLLAQLIKEVAAAVEADKEAKKLPEWDWEKGLIDGERLQEHEFADGPIMVSLQRWHQVRINGVNFDFEGLEPIQDDEMIDKAMDFFSDQFSWDNGQNVTDAYLIAMLFGETPGADVLSAFKDGYIVIDGLDGEDVQRIVNNWPAFWAKRYDTDIDLGCMSEHEGMDS